MDRDFIEDPASSNDPYKWETFTRELEESGFAAETTPGSDAQFLGGSQRATGVIAIDFNGLTSITYQVVYFISKAEAFFPGPTFTKTPTQPPEKVDLLALPWGIMVTAVAGDGNPTFYVGVTDRRSGGN